MESANKLSKAVNDLQKIGNQNPNLMDLNKFATVGNSQKLQKFATIMKDSYISTLNIAFDATVILKQYKALIDALVEVSSMSATSTEEIEKLRHDTIRLLDEFKSKNKENDLGRLSGPLQESLNQLGAQQGGFPPAVLKNIVADIKRQ
jgi:hypothetical protein